ncbi:KGGVGR-motif variant AAA ATPase [Amycolatopsis sp. 195334CR]|uniref:tyrosine-protein kinase family protein n=1 Tax=Amycolatopsis sp. 195334CR TaxID=2814588 RepID=UPI001A8EF7FE|nr:AAA family ATPase [Amycolatopsis sp. 195334CR]MBN6034746.1 AAA family ATPase [Amycolatopsis sp. 195334CR]
MSTGTVITFYSYKGGVGRSFTLANVAVLLARWGYRVLTVDWDLEAPGLQHYFAKVLSEEPERGVVDLAHAFLAGQADPQVVPVKVDVEGGKLDLLAAGRVERGRLDGSYTRRMQALNWEELYRKGFADFLEQRRAEWVDQYDFVLIDSRTGVSDIAGICTAQLPDRLVVVFTANDQNLNDVVDVVRRADNARDRLPYDRPRHSVLPVLSRLDNRVEYERAEKWQRRCAEVVGPLFRNWLVKTVPEELMLRHLTVPYVSYWSFGEQLPVLEEQVPKADQISFALETVAAVIARQFDRTDVLADNRDAYVAAARERDREFDLDLLVSSPRRSMRTATELVEELRLLGLRAAWSFSGDPDFLDEVPQPAEHLCLVVDGEPTRWQTTEAESFLRHTLGPGGKERQLFCVLARGTDREKLPGFLRSLQHLDFLPGMRPVKVARELHDLVTAIPATDAGPDQEALESAAAALRGLPSTMPYSGRFTVIREAVRGMATALDDGDLALLLDRSTDLALLTKAHANGAGIAAPPDLLVEVADLLSRIDRRINAFTD